MEDKAVRGISWTVLGLGFNKGLATVTTVVLAALLSPSDFGLVAIGLIVTNFVTWFGGSSFGSTLIVHQDLDARGQGTVLSLSLLGAAGAGLGTLALAPVVASSVGKAELTAVLGVLSVSVFISGLTGFYEALLQNHLEFRRRFIAQATQTAVFTITSITLAALGAGVWSLVAGSVLSQALFTVTLIVMAPYRVTPAWDRERLRALFATGCGFALQGLTAFVRQNADVVAVGRAFSAASIGFYSMAYRLGDLTYSALADPIARVTFPAFARGLARGEDIRPAFMTVLRLVGLVTVPCGVILSAAGGPFTRTLFGPEWAPMVGVLSVVGVWAAIHPAEATLRWLLNSLGQAGAVGRLSVVVLGPLIVALVIVVGFGDLALVALVPLADTLVSLCVLSVLVGRHAGVSPGALARGLAPVALAGAICWVATRVTADALGDVPALLGLAGATAAGAGVFVVTVLLVDRALIASAITQALRILRPRPLASE